MILESGGSHVLHPIVKVAARVDLHAALIQHFTFRHCCLSFSLVDCGFSRSVNGCGSASVTMDWVPGVPDFIYGGLAWLSRF